MRKLVRLDLATNQIDDTKKKNIKLGQYQVLLDRQIGTGAFSKVYLCKSLDNKIAAVKIISKQKNRSDHAVTLAKSQAKILKPLQHENIVKLIQSYQSSRNFYIILEYLDGKTLKQILQKNLILSYKQKISMICQLITIFRYLHYKNIAHRDIKPENIKLRKNNKITLLDFGFAKQLMKGEQTIMSQCVGTPSYMSPQMLSKNRYTAKTDIWSLGVVIYEIFYQKVPFKGRDQNELLKNISQNKIDFPKKPKACKTVKQLIKCCLKPNPSERINWQELFLFEDIKLFQQSEKEEEICCKC